MRKEDSDWEKKFDEDYLKTLKLYLSNKNDSFKQCLRTILTKDIFLNKITGENLQPLKSEITQFKNSISIKDSSDYDLRLQRESFYTCAMMLIEDIIRTIFNRDTIFELSYLTFQRL
jgi:hypothetical protein